MQVCVVDFQIICTLNTIGGDAQGTFYTVALDIGTSVHGCIFFFFKLVYDAAHCQVRVPLPPHDFATFDNNFRNYLKIVLALPFGKINERG